MTGAGVRWWIDASETRDLSHDYWTSWGMPDDALYRIARNRYQDSLKKGELTFIGVLTVSNHTPYSFPETDNGQHLSKDHVGGTRYADHAMNELIAALRKFPVDERPIIFVTSDTSYIENLRKVEPWGIPSARRVTDTRAAVVAGRLPRRSTTSTTVLTYGVEHP